MYWNAMQDSTLTSFIPPKESTFENGRHILKRSVKRRTRINRRFIMLFIIDGQLRNSPNDGHSLFPRWSGTSLCKFTFMDIRDNCPAQWNSCISINVCILIPDTIVVVYIQIIFIKFIRSSIYGLTRYRTSNDHFYHKKANSCPWPMDTNFIVLHGI